MDRREFAALAAGSLVGLPLGARAQQKGKPWRVGFLSQGPRPSDGRVPAALRDAMQTLGYVEGKDVVYEGRWAGLRSRLLLSLAGELISLKQDLVVAMGEGPAGALQKASSAVPIIAVNAGDLVEIGLVTSLARPGGNLTGINDQSVVLSGKRLELLKEVVPAATRVAVLWNADLRGMTLRYREIEKAAQLLGITIQPLGVREPDDFDDALAAMDRAPPDALMMVTDALTNLNRQRVIDYAAAHRIPAMYEFGSLVQGGGLMSYGGDIGENYRLAASYIVKIFKGAKPGDLPVEQPNRHFLFINIRTAQSLGLKIPQSLLLRADQVVE